MIKKALFAMALLSVSASALAVKWQCTGCTIYQDGSIFCTNCHTVP